MAKTKKLSEEQETVETAVSETFKTAEDIVDSAIADMDAETVVAEESADLKDAEEKEAEEARIAKELEEKKAEEARIAKELEEKEAEEARIAEEKKAEEARIAKELEEKEAEEARIAKELEEKEAEEARIAEEKKAEEARIAEEKEAEEARIAEEKKAEEARIAKESALNALGRKTTEALKASEPIESTGSEYDVWFEELNDLLKQKHYYSYLNCGRLLKRPITRENIILFKKEFAAYGISSNIDVKVMEMLQVIPEQESAE